MTLPSDTPYEAVPHDVVGVVRYRLDRLPVYERRFRRTYAVNLVWLVIALAIVLAWLAAIPALGTMVVPLALVFALGAIVPAYGVVATRRFRNGLPRAGGPDVALVVRRSGLDIAWPDLGPSRLVSLTWGEIADVGRRGPMRGTLVLRIRTRRRPTGSWWRVAYMPEDLLDTPVDVVVRDVHALRAQPAR